MIQARRAKCRCVHFARLPTEESEHKRGQPENFGLPSESLEILWLRRRFVKIQFSNQQWSLPNNVGCRVRPRHFHLENPRHRHQSLALPLVLLH